MNLQSATIVSKNTVSRMMNVLNIGDIYVGVVGDVVFFKATLQMLK